MSNEKRVYLWYLAGNRYGGWATFVRHLSYGLRELGWDPIIAQVKRTTENKLRPFGFGLSYRNISLEDALEVAKNRPSIIAMLGKQFLEPGYELLKAGVPIVVHDAAELAKNKVDKDNRIPLERIVVVRPANAVSLLPNSNFIPLPYRRFFADDTRPAKTRSAVSIARLDWDKHTDIIISANKQLEDSEHRVEMYGKHNRIYAFHGLAKIHPDWKEWVQDFPSEEHFGINLVAEARIMVDLSHIEGDGGGTQYTFLESWDGGTVPVVNTDWSDQAPADTKTKFEPLYMRPGKNCIAVSTAEDLAKVLETVGEGKGYDRLELMVNQGQESLEAHDCVEVAKQYLKHMGV